MTYQLGEKRPRIHATAFIAPTAAVIGDVTLEANTSVWFGAVLRGDSGPIYVGEGTNIQDGAVVHETTTIGKNCTIGHLALVHACGVADNVLIGNGALVYDGCEIGEGAIIGAGAVVTPGTRVAPYTLMLGVPARPASQVSEHHRDRVERAAHTYIERAQEYRQWLRPLNVAPYLKRRVPAAYEGADG